MGPVEKKVVTFTTNSAVEKLLTTSKGKCGSIQEIAKYEYESMGRNLRLLILTDYIRNEYEKVIGTKSLLGEGWDRPCINSLILASFVGSYFDGDTVWLSKAQIKETT